MASDDALGLFQQMRPPSPALSPEIRRASGNLPAGAPDLHSLAMVPGTPGYNARIPKPPCYTCGEDHHANMTYNHAWEPEPVHDEPVSASAIMRRPVPDVFVTPETTPSTPTQSLQRVALYVGRGDTYVVAVEKAPDWEAETTFKVEPDRVLALVNMARALGVKISDKTGGDLLMLEQEHGRSQLAQDHVRGAEGPGDREPRRQGPDAHRAKKDKPGEGSSAPG
jgi:hypothetical protein